MNPRKLHRKLISYIKFKELAKSIKLVALSQLSSFKKKISSRGIPLSSIIPFFNKSNYNINYNKCLIIPIGVDKSCRGPHNGNIFKKSEKIIEFLEDSNKTINIFTIGNRMKDFFKKYYTNFFIGNVYNVDKEPLSLTTSFIITEKILEKNNDRLFFIFNRYYTPFHQKTSIYEITGKNDFYSFCLGFRSKKRIVYNYFFNFLHKLNDNTLQNNLDDIYFHSFSMLLLDSLEENEYSSLGARVTATDNSTQNAIKMIDVIRLLYNKARQSSITNESIEIVSAANFIS